MRKNRRVGGEREKVRERVVVGRETEVSYGEGGLKVKIVILNKSYKIL